MISWGLLKLPGRSPRLRWLSIYDNLFLVSWACGWRLNVAEWLDTSFSDDSRSLRNVSRIILRKCCLMRKRKEACTSFEMSSDGVVRVWAKQLTLLVFWTTLGKERFKSHQGDISTLSVGVKFGHISARLTWRPKDRLRYETEIQWGKDSIDIPPDSESEFQKHLCNHPHPSQIVMLKSSVGSSSSRGWWAGSWMACNGPSAGRT